MNPTPLLVVLPYCKKDIALTRKLLEWIEVLSPKLAPHCCLLAVDSQVEKQVIIEFRDRVRRIFDYAEAALVNVPEEESGRWPSASNAMFRIASRHVGECFRLPWLWLEPDCTPLLPSWLDLLALAYTRSPKKYLGAQIRSEPMMEPTLPPVHLAGCAIYPPDAFVAMEPYCKPDASRAWDIGNAEYVIPRSLNTPLIHHVYGTMDMPPIFKAVKEPGDPANTCTLGFVRPDAALFHRCKDGSLIDLLAARRQSQPVTAASSAEKPKPGRRGRPAKPAEAPTQSQAPEPTPA